MAIIFSCRKTDFKTFNRGTPLVDKARFFTIQGKVSSSIVRINQELLLLNNKVPFVSDFIEQAGYPRWDKSFFLPNRATTQRTNHRVNNADSTFIIPVVSQSDKYVTGALIVNISDTLSYRLALLKNYQAYNNSKVTFIQSMMILDAKVYGYGKFKVVDTSALNGIREVFLKKRGNSPSTAANRIQLTSDPYEDPCERIELWYDPDGDDDRCDCDGNEYPSGQWVYANDEECLSGTPSPVLYFLTAGIGGGGNSLPGTQLTLPPDLGGGGTGGPLPPPYIPVPTTEEQKRDYLIEQLNLNQLQQFYLENTDNSINSLFNYLYYNNSEASKQNCINHLNALSEDSGYNQFVLNHNITGDQELVWWSDSVWLSNPNNFNLDITFSNNPIGLTAEEKWLVGQYPLAAYIIFQNKDEAFEMSDIKMGISSLALNDKKDAFRHAYFNAINVRDIPNFLYPYTTPANIVLAFATAHESESPPQLALEVQMDLYNNSVGIQVGQNVSYWTSGNDIANTIKTKINNGELKYLSPLNFNTSPLWPAGKNGITDSTQLLWTNQ
jgi:hypothetical protein